MDAPDETRERILVAALAVIARVGHAKATTREIAREAGVAQGLANYHFGSRQALLREAVVRVRERFMAEVAERIPAAAGDGPETLRQVLELTRAIVESQPDWYRLLADIDAIALREPAVAAEAAGVKAAGAAAVQQYVDVVYEAFGREPEPESAAVAAVAIAAFDGLATRALLDPTFDHLGAFAELERMILAVVAPGATPSPRPWRTGVLGFAPPPAS